MRELLDVLPEPSLLVQTSGGIASANPAATALLGIGLRERHLADLAPPHARIPLRDYITRCSGSRQLLPGTATLHLSDGTTMRFRCSGCLAAPANHEAPALVFLRLAKAEDQRFATLARKVQDLNDEIRERRRMQAVLEEALRDREIMLRELHHRVKNSVQMLVGMISAAQRETGSSEGRAVLQAATRRLMAIGSVHQMLYRTDNVETLDAGRFVAEMSASVLRGFGAEARLKTEAPAGTALANDVAIPLALILNELLANAVKHGTAEGDIRVSLRRAEGGFTLSVENDGAGFEPAAPEKRASGLGLVRGLARQIGAAFVIGTAAHGGPICTLHTGSLAGLPSGQGAAA